MSLSEEPLLFIDCQTTGATPEHGHLLEIAWALGSAGDVAQGRARVESALVALPEGAVLPRRITTLTGIDQVTLADAAAASAVAERLAAAVSERVTPAHCVIHFARFERPFLEQLWREGLAREALPWTLICTHEIARRLFPNLPSRGIRGLAGYFGEPLEELKRAGSHVEATMTIWTHLARHLEEQQGIGSLAELTQWLEATTPEKRGKREYPLAREKRLALPQAPGVYRMIGRGGKVLYVGKATSLHSRVNSYFRGQKGRDPRKLEMLTQTWDVVTTVTGSAVEAALLETDEIKRHSPPYNIALRTGARSIAYYRKDFLSVASVAGHEHDIGPFPSLEALTPLLLLSISVASRELAEDVVYGLTDGETFEAGVAMFCEEQAIERTTLIRPRAMLALGYRLLRAERGQAIDEVGEVLDDDEVEDLDEDSDEEFEHTPETVCASIGRLLRNAAALHYRARWLTFLADADLIWRTAKRGAWHHIVCRDGHVVASDAIGSLKEWSPSRTVRPPSRIADVASYDRMRVLFTELRGMIKSGAQVGLALSGGACLDQGALGRILIG